jgi:hypothetical protein
MGTLAQSIKHTGTLDNGESYTNFVSAKLITTTTDAPAHKTTQDVDASYEPLSVGDVNIASRYAVALRNASAAATLYVNLSTSTAGSDFLQLAPGELAAFPVKGGVNVFLLGSAADTPVEVVVHGL